MNFFANNKPKIKYQSHNYQKRVRNQWQFLQKINNLRMEIIDLKQSQKTLMTMIYEICCFVTQEILSIVSKMKKQFLMKDISHKQNLPKFQSQAFNNNIRFQLNRENIQNEIKIQQIKSNDLAIKNEILEKLKTLKMLENKQNLLRIENQKQEKLRRSLSKESIFKNSLKQLRNQSKKASQISLRWNTINYSKNENITDQSKNNSLQNSPTFGSSDRHKDFPKVQSFKKIQNFNQSSEYTKTQTLICENKHEYYKGNLLNNIPHGKGVLIICCQKIPIKINTKTLKYYGNFENGFFQGKGVLFCKGNIRFQGNFVKGKRHGEGIINLQGKCQKGIWQNDKLISFI